MLAKRYGHVGDLLPTRTPTVCSACSTRPRPSTHRATTHQPSPRWPLCGFVAALIAWRLRSEKLRMEVVASVVLVFGVLIVPRVTVGIVDRTGGSAVRVVDNVLWVAVLGSLTSTIGTP